MVYPIGGKWGFELVGVQNVVVFTDGGKIGLWKMCYINCEIIPPQASKAKFIIPIHT